MRGWFEQWGLPARLRVDNGNPWSNRTELPPALALGWVGLGIEPIWNPPRCPTANPFVERCNGLLDTWGEPGRCRDAAAWRVKLAELCRIQREEYETARGCSRLAAYPELREVRRPYQEASEEQQWQLARVLTYLAQGRWPRRVSKIGQIHLYGQPYRVGGRFAREQVWVQLDAERVEWVVRREDGTELIRHAARQLTTERICQLKVAHPRPLSQKEKQRQLRRQTASELQDANPSQL
jgi:hypothetical protein